MRPASLPALVRHCESLLRPALFNDYDGAAKWNRRRVSLVDEIGDPDHQQDIYYTAFGPAVACGNFDEARGYARSHEEITRRLGDATRVVTAHCDAAGGATFALTASHRSRSHSFPSAGKAFKASACRLARSRTFPAAVRHSN